MQQEIERKRALSMVLSQTKQQEKKDAEVFTLFQGQMSCIFIISHQMSMLCFVFLHSLLFQVLAEAKRIAESRMLARVSFELDFLIHLLSDVKDSYIDL